MKANAMRKISLREYQGDRFISHPILTTRLSIVRAKIVMIYSLCWACFLPSLNAQWIELNTGTSAYLRDVHFINDDYGAVVGDGGTILLTENAGQDWEDISADITDDLHAVLVWNKDTLLVSGRKSGQVGTYLSTNGGMNWSLVNDAFEIARTTDRLLSCGYDAFDWSDDSGQTWMPSGATIGSTTLISQIEIADTETAIASGNVSGFTHYSFYAYRTNDTGANWAPLYVFDMPNSDSWTTSAYPHADTLFVFTNQQVNFLPGSKNSLVRLSNFYFDTNNGIDSWRFDSETINETLPTYVQDAAFVNGNMGYLVGENGQIYRTMDGGNNWSSIYMGNTSLQSIALIDMEIAYVVGKDGLILKNENLTSILPPTTQDQLEIWPNPTIDEVNISGIDLPATQLFLYDMSSRLIKSWTWHQGETIDLRGLAQGQYLLSVQLRRQRVTYPIIKQ